jgi:exopolyphosphatase/guanosine-5'-triphosphate,3'-diphosphate pyrophosphatase
MQIAAIDIGTNSLHMIVCRVRPDLSFEVVDREKDMVRLGTGGLDRGRLSESSVAAAIQTLSKFHRLAASHGVEEMIVTATSAVREAENGPDFVAEVKRAVGLHIRVISGTEEARLIHLAAGYAADLGRRAGIVIDIGGGSTEITVGTAERLQSGRSFKLGVIRLTERFARTDPLSRHDERALVRHIRKECGEYLAQLSRRRIDRVIGTSGTILSLGALAAGKRASDDVRNVRVSAKAISRVRRELTSMTLADRLKMPNLDPRRADLSPAGAVLIDTLLDGLGADEIVLCDFALREGLVLDYIKQNAAHIKKADRYPDVRRRSVIELAEKSNDFATHAHQVARVALSLFDATRARHGLGQRERDWLEYGALLHDIGLHISYERHHRHSHYLIQHGGLRGFDPQEVSIIALIARYHRQATPKKSHEGYQDLDQAQRTTVRLLGAFVRLAEGLDRSHAQVIGNVDVRTKGKIVTVRLQANEDAELERWAADRHAAPLAEELGLEIQFELIPPRAGRDHKDAAPHAGHARHAAHVSGPPVRRRGHRRIGKDDATRTAG